MFAKQTLLLVVPFPTEFRDVRLLQNWGVISGVTQEADHPSSIHLGDRSELDIG